MLKIDSKRVEKQFVKNLSSYNVEAVVQKRIARKLSDLVIKNCKSNFNRVFEIGCGTGFFTREIISKICVKQYFINDLSQLMFKEVLKHIKSHLHKHLIFLEGDIEHFIFPKNFDAIFSNVCFHWLENPEKLFKKISISLNTNGILAFSTFGPQNFKEIKQIFNISLNYLSINELVENIIARGFKIIYQEEWSEKQHFKSIISMLKNLKSIGVTGMTNKIWTQNMLKSYLRHFSELDCISLTYHPVIIIAEKQ